jgi:hypothetical protein
VYRALFGKNGFYDAATVFAVQGKSLAQVAVQGVTVLQYEQGPSPSLGQLEGGLHEHVDIDIPGPMRAAQEKSNRIGLNQHLTDLVPEDNHDDKNSDRANPLKKPACQHQPDSLGDSLKHPEE